MPSIDSVLVVDDSALIRSMYRLALRRYDCEIVEAENGLEALDALSIKGSFDLILLDVNMPMMNGLQFMKRLGEVRGFRDIPVIVISTEGEEDDATRAMELGAMGYLVKPFRQEQLQKLVEKVCSIEQRTRKTSSGVRP